MSKEPDAVEIRANEGTHLERLVLYRLDESSQRLAQIESRLRAMELEIQTMRVKAGIWGLLAGLIPAAIIVVATQVQT
jgi:division protein CdvB (Snf7/Vps24/ESCRT-III family)